MRKIEGGLQALATWVEQSGSGTYLIGNQLTLADISIGSALGWFTIRYSDHPWQSQYPKLKKYWDGLEARKSFSTTRPSPQTMKDKIV